MSPLNMLSNIFTDWFLRGQQEGTEGHSTETYFSTTTPILYGSYRGKKHQIIQQSLKTALDVLNNRTNKSGHQSSTWPDKVEEDYWINQPINAALRHHKIHLVNVEPCSKEFEALEFSKNKDKYGYSVLLQLVLALARCPLSVVGACDSAIEKELTDVVMGPINSHIQSVKAKTTPVSTTKKEEGHEEDENERNEGLVKLKQGDISPWLISTLKNIKPIEQYEFNIDIKSDNNASSSSSASRRLVKRSEKIAFSSRIHLRDYSPSSMPSSHVSLPDHIIDESAHRLYKRLTSIVSGSACIIVLMDVMKWIDEFSKQKQKDLEAERIHHSPQHKCTDGWVSYEWDVFRSMLRKCLESNGNLHFVLTTLPTPRDSLDPDFFSNESLSDHPFISRFLGESKRAVEEPIEAGLLLWRNEPLLSCAKSINLNNGIPTKHSSSVNLVARKESLREKLENSHEMLAVISKREKRKYSPAAPDTVIVAIVDALKLNEPIRLLKVLRKSYKTSSSPDTTISKTTTTFGARILSNQQYGSSIIFSLKDAFLNAPLDSEMSIEFSSQGGDDDDADQLAAAAGQKILHARGLCATLAKVISEIIAAAAEVSSSSHFSNFYTHENKALMHKCQKMIREEGNTEEILNASHLLKNIISLYYNNQSLSSPQARLEKKSISSLWMPCIKQVLTHADFLRSALQIKGNNVALSSMDKVINDHRIQLYESATGLLDLVCTQSFIEGIINSMEEADEMVSVAMHFSPSLSQIYRLLIHLISTSSQSSDQDNQIKRLDELLSRSIHFTGRLVLHYTSKVEVGTDMSTSNRHGLIRSLVEISACSNYTGKQRTESTTTTTTTHYRVIELNCKQVALNLLRQMGSHAIIDKAPHVGTVQQLWSATHHDQYYYYSPSSSQTMVLNRKCSLDWDRFIDNVYV